MVLLVDSSGNNQNERAFYYPATHTSETTPQPTGILPVPFGQAAVAYFDGADNKLLIQDHTWNRILFLTVSP